MEPVGQTPDGRPIFMQGGQRVVKDGNRYRPLYREDMLDGRATAAPQPRVNALEQFFNGTGIPARVGVANSLFNPVTGLQEAGQHSVNMLAPGRAPTQRISDAGKMLSGMAGTVAPMYAASRGAVPTANAMVDALTGINMPGGEFMADEFGGVKMPGKGIEDTLKAKYPDAKISITESPTRGLVLNRIELPKDARGKGTGTQIMSDLLAEADARGATVALSPSGDFGGSVPRLKEFYSRLGFVPNKGRTADYGISESMYRLPKEPATPSRPISGTAAHPGGPLNNPMGITAYHGSPHSFDKFSMDKIGAGEGTQNQGWGLYFAARKNDAQYYADTYGGETGQMYKVKIGASPKEFLDWSVNVGDMPKAMQDKIRALSGGFVPPDTPGRKAYAMIKERLGTDEAASKALRAADVPGVKYGTHGMGQNYVVFDENLIEIVRKYGIAGAAAMLGVSAMDVEQAMAGQK